MYFCFMRLSYHAFLCTVFLQVNFIWYCTDFSYGIYYVVYTSSFLKKYYKIFSYIHKLLFVEVRNFCFYPQTSIYGSYFNMIKINWSLFFALKFNNILTLKLFMHFFYVTRFAAQRRRSLICVVEGIFWRISGIFWQMILDIVVINRLVAKSILWPRLTELLKLPPKIHFPVVNTGLHNYLT